MRNKSIFILLLLFSVTLLAERTRLTPGTKSDPNKDVELGRQVAQDAEKQLVLLKHADANAYINALGQQLVMRAPNEFKFPFTFKIVDEREINAFALPGGPIYVNRGAIESADNEAQIAGVMAHEIGHVVLRHGIAQAEKAQRTQLLFSLPGAILGGNVGQVVGAAGAFAGSSLILKYSRGAETEADLMGTQILYDSRYDPRAMADFFEKLAKDHKGT